MLTDFIYHSRPFAGIIMLYDVVHDDGELVPTQKEVQDLVIWK